MLKTTPFHKEDYSRLVLGVVIQFYQQCSDQSRDLVARETMGAGQPSIIKAAQWTQNQEVTKCLKGMLKTSVRTLVHAIDG
jgi:exocyst complex component 4